MPEVTYLPNRARFEGRYEIEFVDGPIHLTAVRVTFWGARRAVRKMQRQAARHRQRMRRVEAMTQ